MSGAIQATFAGIAGGSQTKCAPVTFIPADGSDAPGIVALSTATIGAHIFYTKNNDTGITPTHNGDNATGVTVRIGSNSGTVNGVGSINHVVILEALAYKAGLLDSDVTMAAYNPEAPGGGA